MELWTALVVFITFSLIGVVSAYFTWTEDTLLVRVLVGITFGALITLINFIMCIVEGYC